MKFVGSITSTQWIQTMVDEATGQKWEDILSEIYINGETLVTTNDKSYCGGLDSNGVQKTQCRHKIVVDLNGDEVHSIADALRKALFNGGKQIYLGDAITGDSSGQGFPSTTNGIVQHYRCGYGQHPCMAAWTWNYNLEG